MNCKACGRVIPEDSEFCSYCGTNQMKCEEFRENTEAYAGSEMENKEEPELSMKILDGAKEVTKIVIEPVMNKSIDIITKQVKKTLDKSAQKKVNTFLKKVGLKKKNPIDYVKDKISKK